MVREFRVPTGGNGDEVVSRGEVLRRLIAATYDVAREKIFFSIDDVYQKVDPINGAQVLRRAVATSKLAAVALRKSEALGYIERTNGQVTGDRQSHGRKKAVWHSLIQGD